MPLNLRYQVLDREHLNDIKGLWLQLRRYHRDLPWAFATTVEKGVFEKRREELLLKTETGDLRVDVVSTKNDGEPIAYCVSSISSDHFGEIDSMFVIPVWRRRGIGSELIRRALLWFDQAGVKQRQVVLACANTDALALYERFGFRARTITMQQAEPGAAHEPPPAAAVGASSESMNTRPESGSAADGGGR